MKRFTIAVAVLALAVLTLAGCAGDRSGAVTPTLPGPVDLVRMAFGDYSGRCPPTYQYCSGTSQAICCPIDDRCEEDSGGVFCAPRSPQRSARAWDESGPTCTPDQIVCSYLGRTVCCGSQQRCCATEGGPACCGSP